MKKGDLLAVLYSVDLGNKKNDLFDALSQLRLDEEVLKRAEAYKAAVPEVFLLNAKRNVQADINAVSRAENTLEDLGDPGGGDSGRPRRGEELLLAIRTGAPRKRTD